MENLREAYQKTCRGKRDSFSFLEFKEYSGANLSKIREEFMDGSWEQSPCKNFMVYDPKPRLISALEFKDRVAQHAVMNIVGPILDSALLPYTFGCRNGKGAHAGVRHIQSHLRKTGATHFLKTDFSKFFPSIDRAILHRLLQRKIGCARTMQIIRSMTPDAGVGLGIGYLTSQVFANTYGGMVDRFIHFNLGAKSWARYVDDIVILGNDPRQLHEWHNQIRDFSEQKMNLKISKWQVSCISRGINFLGYRIWPKHKLLRKSSVTRAKKKIKSHTNNGDLISLARFAGAWKGHVIHADAKNLLTHLNSLYGFTNN